ncbi:Uncharacterized protein SCF082_LOCUS27926, partial [Durusdinium trenchii]
DRKGIGRERTGVVFVGAAGPRAEEEEEAERENLDREADAPMTSRPVNITPGGSRGFTPDRRRSSRPRSRQHEREGSEVYVAGIERPESASKRPVSQRKERRWANDRRIGAQAPVLGAAAVSGAVQNANDAAYDPDLEAFDVTKASRMIFQREHDSCFDGFTDELRRAFLDCTDGFVRASAPQRSSDAPQSSPRSAADRFAKVDRKLRQHLLQTGSREPFLSFLRELEAFVMRELDACQTQGTVAQQDVPEEVKKALVRMPSTGLTSEVPFLDLAFRSGVHRLLTHGMCQFHGLSSKSFDDPSNAKVRVLRVTFSEFDPLLSGWVVHDGIERSDSGVREFGALFLGLVVDPRQKVELVYRELRVRGLQLPSCVQWVTAARVGPIPREGDLLVGPLLQQQFALRVEQKDAERAVQQPFVDVAIQVAFLFGAGADDVVIPVHHDDA